MRKRIVSSVVEELEKDVRSEARHRGTERVEKHFRIGESRFMRSGDHRWRAKLDFSSGESFDDHHRPTTLGQDQRSLGPAVEAFCWVCGVPPSSWKESGKVVARLQLARMPKLRMRTKPSEQVQQEAAQELIER